jgi:hypothetical protein
VPSEWSKVLGEIYDELPIEEVQETTLVLREKNIEKEEDLPF